VSGGGRPARGKKLANICSFVDGRIIVQQEKFRQQKPSFRIRRATVLEMFKDYAVILNAIRAFSTKSTATALMFTSVRVDLDGPSRHLLPATIRLEIVNTI
jgi:hypothetical protein